MVTHEVRNGVLAKDLTRPGPEARRILFVPPSFFESETPSVSRHELHDGPGSMHADQLKDGQEASYSASTGIVRVHSWKPWMSLRCLLLLQSWYEVGTKLVRSWNEFGTKLVPTGVGTRLVPNGYQIGTKLTPSWHQLHTKSVKK